MDGRTDGWMDEWMVQWMEGRMDGWMDGRMDGWMNGLMDGWIDGQVWWVDEWMHEWMYGWIDGWMDPWMDIKNNNNNSVIATLASDDSGIQFLSGKPQIIIALRPHPNPKFLRSKPSLILATSSAFVPPINPGLTSIPIVDTFVKGESSTPRARWILPAVNWSMHDWMIERLFRSINLYICFDEWIMNFCSYSMNSFICGWWMIVWRINSRTYLKKWHNSDKGPPAMTSI